MATNRAPIVGVFDDRARAEKAIEELYNAGVSSDRISYSGREHAASNNIVSNLKNLFGGATESHKASEIVKDLTNLGLSQDEAQYYAQEYEAGHTIVAIQPSEQVDNTMTILRSNGAHDFNSRANYEKIGGYAKGSSYTGTTTTGADAMAQRTDDSPTNVQPDTSTRFNQPTSAYEQSAATGSAPSSAYDQGAQSTSGQNAAVGNQTAGRYEQGTADTIQQQTNYNRDANIGTPPTSDPDYSQRDINVQNQPDYSQQSSNTQDRPAYDRPINNPSMSNRPYSQDPTDPNAYQDPNAGQYYQDPDTEARDQDSNTVNPFKKIVRHLKGEHDPDADYNREQRSTDPNQNF